VIPRPKLRFNVSGPKGAYVGVWANSPDEETSRKHAVYAIIDKSGKMRARVHPETKAGVELTEGFPSGAGNAMIAPTDIIYDPQLVPLTYANILSASDRTISNEV